MGILITVIRGYKLYLIVMSRVKDPPPLNDPSYDPRLAIRAKISMTQAHFIPSNINSVVSVFPSDLI